MNQFSDFLFGALAESLQGGEAGEEGGGDQIDPGVGALGGQPGGDEQLEGVLVVQGAEGVGVLGLKGLHGQKGQLGTFHKRQSFSSFWRGKGNRKARSHGIGCRPAPMIQQFSPVDKRFSQRYNEQDK